MPALAAAVCCKRSTMVHVRSHLLVVEVFAWHRTALSLQERAPCTTSEATCQWSPQTSTETATGGARTVVGLRPPAVGAPPAPHRPS
jgi:hypothetical protein